MNRANFQLNTGIATTEAVAGDPKFDGERPSLPQVLPRSDYYFMVRLRNFSHVHSLPTSVRLARLLLLKGAP
jgi:hypothetical protein